MERRGADPDQYLQSLPADVRDDTVGFDALITTAMPGRRRVVWEGTFWGGAQQTIIGYGDLLQERPGGQRSSGSWWGWLDVVDLTCWVFGSVCAGPEPLATPTVGISRLKFDTLHRQAGNRW